MLPENALGPDLGYPTDSYNGATEYWATRNSANTPNITFILRETAELLDAWERYFPDLYRLVSMDWPKARCYYHEPEKRLFIALHKVMS